MSERRSGRDINIQTDRIFKLDSVNSVFISVKLFSHAGVPGENRLRLQQICSSVRDLQQACSRTVFDHTPARGLQHTRRLNKNITFIYKCSICGCAAGLLQACDQKQACCTHKRFSPGVASRYPNFFNIALIRSIEYTAVLSRLLRIFFLKAIELW